MIKETMEEIYEGCAEAFCELGYILGDVGRLLLTAFLVITIPLWALPYWAYHDRKRGRK